MFRRDFLLSAFSLLSFGKLNAVMDQYKLSCVRVYQLPLINRNITYIDLSSLSPNESDLFLKKLKEQFRHNRFNLKGNQYVS